MGDFICYLLKSSVLLAVLVPAFMMLMSRMRTHRLNRTVFLLLMLAAVATPMIDLGVNSPWPQISQNLEAPYLLSAIADSAGTGYSMPVGNAGLFHSLFWLWFTGALFALLRLLWIHRCVIMILRRGRLVDASTYTAAPIRLLVHTSNVAPFSYFAWVVVSRADLDSSGGRCVVDHEVAHVQRRHSLDCLFVDLLICLLWFNPVAYMAKNVIKDIHEFEADEAVVTNGVAVYDYSMLLIRKTVGDCMFSIANNFNYSRVEKRISMMYAKIPGKAAWLRVICMIPLSVIAITMFSSSAVGDLSHIATVGTRWKRSAPVKDQWKTLPEIMPAFPDGNKGFDKYVSENMVYPPQALTAGATGAVTVRFLIDEDGFVVESKVTKSSGNKYLDAEAQRLIGHLPKFLSPHYKYGEPHPVWMEHTVVFDISENK